MELASQFRFFDKSKQRKPVKASEKADRRMVGRRRGGKGGKRERGSVSCANEGLVTFTRKREPASSRDDVRSGESRGVHYQCFLRYSLKAITAR